MGVLGAYRNSLKQVQLSGPTLFAPVIGQVRKCLRAMRQHRTSHQGGGGEGETRHIVTDASAVMLARRRELTVFTPIFSTTHIITSCSCPISFLALFLAPTWFLAPR